MPFSECFNVTPFDISALNLNNYIVEKRTIELQHYVGGYILYIVGGIPNLYLSLYYYGDNYIYVGK
jgi:hypothetical protein